MAEILITGGAGNIGSALAAKLASQEENTVVIVDNLLTGSLSKVTKNTMSPLSKPMSTITGT